MARIAKETGLSREQLYRSFSQNGNPTLKTTLALMKALKVGLVPHVEEQVQSKKRLKEERATP